MLMGWDLTDFTLQQRGELATAFEFEISYGSEAGGVGTHYRGDGLLLCSGRVRFNREQELLKLAGGLGLNPQNFLAYLADWIVAHSQTGAEASA